MKAHIKKNARKTMCGNDATTCLLRDDSQTLPEKKECRRCRLISYMKRKAARK